MSFCASALGLWCVQHLLEFQSDLVLFLVYLTIICEDSTNNWVYFLIIYIRCKQTTGLPSAREYCSAN